jgi:hypothetical protein
MADSIGIRWRNESYSGGGLRRNTHEYEKKIESVAKDELYAFRLDANIPDPNVRIHPYDADTQKMKIDIETRWLSNYKFKDHRAGIIFRKIDKGSDSYVGSNAFGATRLVRSHFATHYGIALINQEYFGSSSDDEFAKLYGTESPLKSIRKESIEIVVPLDKAKRIKNNIGILLLCKPTLYKSKIGKENKKDNALFFKDSYYGGATIDDPVVLSYERNFINMEVIAVWIYDFRTGEIMLKKQT